MLRGLDANMRKDYLPKTHLSLKSFLMYFRRQGHLNDAGDTMKTLHSPYFMQNSAEQVYWGEAPNSYESCDDSHDMSS